MQMNRTFFTFFRWKQDKSIEISNIHQIHINILWCKCKYIFIEKKNNPCRKKESAGMGKLYVLLFGEKSSPALWCRWPRRSPAYQHPYWTGGPKKTMRMAAFFMETYLQRAVPAGVKVLKIIKKQIDFFLPIVYDKIARNGKPCTGKQGAP